MYKKIFFPKPLEQKEDEEDREVIEEAIKNGKIETCARDLSWYLTSNDLYDVEKLYIQKVHASTYYQGLDETKKKEYDNMLGGMMLLIKEQNASCPPNTEDLENRLIKEYTDKRSVY